MRTPRVLCVTSLGNPIGTNWVYGFKGLGFDVAVLDRRREPAPTSQLQEWGIRGDVSVNSFWDEVPNDTRRAILLEFGGEPNILFGWWGSSILAAFQKVRQAFPYGSTVLCVDTLPNASNSFTEVRELWRLRMADRWIDGYVFYSEAMRALFHKRVPSSRGKPYLTIVEPFLRQAFAVSAGDNVPRLERLDEEPHVIFTGRGDKLWTKDPRFAKDAVGPFLGSLAEQGVHVFVPQRSDKKGLVNLHRYPEFSNADLFKGKFAQYVSQFDAHLAIYNECNATIRRRVSTGLSTRLAFAMVATSPIAVTRTSKFIEEYWQQRPFGFYVDSVENLSERLRRTDELAYLRANLEEVHLSYAFEMQAERIVRLLDEVLTQTRMRHAERC